MIIENFSILFDLFFFLVAWKVKLFTFICVFRLLCVHCVLCVPLIFKSLLVLFSIIESVHQLETERWNIKLNLKSRTNHSWFAIIFCEKNILQRSKIYPKKTKNFKFVANVREVLKFGLKIERQHNYNTAKTTKKYLFKIMNIWKWSYIVYR